MSLGGATIVFEAFISTAMAAPDQAFSAMIRTVWSTRLRRRARRGLRASGFGANCKYHLLPRTERRFELPQTSALLAARPRASRASSVDPKPLK